MPITCDRRALHEEAQLTARAIAGPTSLPILNNLVIEPDPLGIRLSATDLELGISCTVPIEGEGIAPVTVPAKQFVELLGALSAASVTLACEETALCIQGADTSYRIHTLPATQFPPLPDVPDGPSLEMSAMQLLEMVRQTAFAASTDDLAPVLTGIQAVLEADMLTMVATDRHRLAVRREGLDGGGRGLSAIIPARLLTQAMRVFTGYAETPVVLRWSPSQLCIETQQRRVTGRLIEGRYPRWESLISTCHPTRLTIARASLSHALRRVAIVAREAENRLRLDWSAERLTLTAQAKALGEVTESLSATLRGDPGGVTLNCRYLHDALAVLSSDRLHIEMSHPMQPILLRPESDTDLQLLIMPLQ